MIISLMLAAALAASPAPVQRCGWLDNPTPGNWSLIDRDGEWLIGVQGGYQAPGSDNLPDMSTKGWVETNAGGHGYGCACMTVTVDKRSTRVTRVVSGRPVPLRQCRADPKLTKKRPPAP
jgi:hypothetical protein